MESERFDRLARTVGQPRSRRSLTCLLGGLGLGGVLSVWPKPETLAAKRKAGEPCTKGRQCKTGKCVAAYGQKLCSCSQNYECPDGEACVRGGCFRAESCAAECTPGTTCGAGVTAATARRPSVASRSASPTRTSAPRSRRATPTATARPAGRASMSPASGAPSRFRRSACSPARSPHRHGGG